MWYVLIYFIFFGIGSTSVFQHLLDLQKLPLIIIISLLAFVYSPQVHRLMRLINKRQFQFGNNCLSLAIVCFWRETHVSYKFTMQIIVIANMLAGVIIHRKFSFPSASLVLGLFISAKTKRSVCFTKLASTTEGLYITSVQQRRNASLSCVECWFKTTIYST